MSAVFPPSPESGGRRGQGFLTASVVLASVALVGGTGAALTLTDNRRSANATANLARSAAPSTATPSAAPPHTTGEPPWAPDSTGAASNPASLGPHRGSTASPSARPVRPAAASAIPASNPASPVASPASPVASSASPVASSAGPAAPTSLASSADLSPQEHLPDAGSSCSLADCRRDHQDLVDRSDAGERLVFHRRADVAGDRWKMPGQSPDRGTSDTAVGGS